MIVYLTVLRSTKAKRRHKAPQSRCWIMSIVISLQRYKIFFPNPNFSRVERGIVWGIERGIEPWRAPIPNLLLPLDDTPTHWTIPQYASVSTSNMRIACRNPTSIIQESFHMLNKWCNVMFFSLIGKWLHNRQEIFRCIKIVLKNIMFLLEIIMKYINFAY
mgnify:FL=1